LRKIIQKISKKLLTFVKLWCTIKTPKTKRRVYMALLLKECRWCGVSFVPTHFNAVYCSEKCRRESVRDRYKSDLPTGYRKTKTLEKGVPTIHDVVLATMEHKKKTGKFISYGKMVANMERR
jgi:hypothetical protein